MCVGVVLLVRGGVCGVQGGLGHPVALTITLGHNEISTHFAIPCACLHLLLKTSPINLTPPLL